uniref:Potassium channel domain-containing protein n=1 Tax=Fusarium oxysporum (strain Fo5176) TaxID=660025 RepID=A0A0D2XRR7_FUSOF
MLGSSEMIPLVRSICTLVMFLFNPAFPMIAGTLGPVASAFSICSLAEPWRQQLVPGGDIQDAPSVPDPPWTNRRCVGARVDDRIRGKIIRKLLHSSDSKSLEPIHEELKTPPTRSNEARETEFERRRAEFALMRKIQAKSSIRRRWVAMAFSTFTWLVLWLVGAFVFQRAEKAYQDWSYFDALYFCFEAWTTIGYGDLTPISNAVLISNASDTVVRIIRDGTILVGNFTILPNDRGFAGNLKSFISKITFGKVFPGNLDSGSPKPVASSKDIDQRSAGTTAEFHGLSLRNDDRGLLDVSFGGQTVSQITGPQNTRAQSLFTSDVRHNGLHELATSTDFQLLLISELQVVIGHLKEPKPHHYTFDQWVWYLKLIGEDEHSPQTHCKVNLEKTRHYPNEDDSDRVFKWSWVGNGSPLLGAEEESKWILGRLMDKLEESLLVQRRWRFGNGSRISLPEARHVQDLDRDGLVDKR